MDKELTDEASPSPKRTTDADITAVEKEMEEILVRARQTVKPIIKREAANEIITEDVLNFRMKTRE